MHPKLVPNPCLISKQHGGNFLILGGELTLDDMRKNRAWYKQNLGCDTVVTAHGVRFGAW